VGNYKLFMLTDIAWKQNKLTHSLKAPGFNFLVSNFAFKFNLYRYVTGADVSHMLFRVLSPDEAELWLGASPDGRGLSLAHNPPFVCASSQLL
jgi:hypothetical protein